MWGHISSSRPKIPPVSGWQKLWSKLDQQGLRMQNCIEPGRSSFDFFLADVGSSKSLSRMFGIEKPINWTSIRHLTAQLIGRSKIIHRCVAILQGILQLCTAILDVDGIQRILTARTFIRTGIIGWKNSLVHRSEVFSNDQDNLWFPDRRDSVMHLNALRIDEKWSYSLR